MSSRRSHPQLKHGAGVPAWRPSLPVVVFKLDGRDIPIVYQVLNVHERVDDRKGGIYPSGQMWLNERHIIGRARGFLPYVGMVTIIMTEYPYLKFLLIGVLGLFVLSNRE